MTRSRKPIADYARRLFFNLAVIAAGYGAFSPAFANTQPDDRSEVTIIDELGRQVTVRPPIRAVYPDLWYQSEIVRAIGALDTIVVVDQTSNPEKSTTNKAYFANLSGVPDAGNYNEPNWETIAESGAEVFFARRNSPWQNAESKLEPFGIKGVVVSTWDPKLYMPNAASTRWTNSPQPSIALALTRSCPRRGATSWHGAWNRGSANISTVARPPIFAKYSLRWTRPRPDGDSAWQIPAFVFLPASTAPRPT